MSPPRLVGGCRLPRFQFTAPIQSQGGLVSISVRLILLMMHPVIRVTVMPLLLSLASASAEHWPIDLSGGNMSIVGILANSVHAETGGNIVGSQGPGSTLTHHFGSSSIWAHPALQSFS